MRNIRKNIILFIICALLIIPFIGCSNERNKENIFGVEQFTSEIKEKGYEFQLQDVEKDFMLATKKRMIIDKEEINIYLYESNKDMENGAKRINSCGCEYNNGTSDINENAISFPRFYKKGNIIVHYFGQNEKIISDLKDVFGAQFVGRE